MNSKHHIWRNTTASYKLKAGSRLTCWRRRMTARLSESQNHRCCYCGCETFLATSNNKLPKGQSWDRMATLEHLIPQSKKQQTNKFENLVMACNECNSIRSNFDPMKFYNVLQRIKNTVSKPYVYVAPILKKIVPPEKAQHIKEKEQRCLVLCLIAFAVDPIASNYWAENWVPPTSRRKNRANKRVRRIQSTGARMRTGTR